MLFCFILGLLSSFHLIPTQMEERGRQIHKQQETWALDQMWMLGLSNHQPLGPGKSEVVFSSPDGGN